IGTSNYLTDFGALPRRRPAHAELVLYTYPNRNDRGGTSAVPTPNRLEVARGEEPIAPGRFSVATWRGRPALYYLAGDTVIVRGARGEPLARLDAPEGRNFRDVYALELPGGWTAAVASGNGYSPFHAVYVYNAADKLVFQEVNNE